MFPTFARILVIAATMLWAVGCASDKPVMFSGTLTCADCEDIGQPANIWKSAYESRLECKLGWGDIVEITDSLNGRYEVKGVGCAGWIGQALVERQ
jgi:hypothetical protein